MVNQLNQHELGHFFIGEGVQNTSPSFFNETDAAFNLGDIFFCYRCVHHDDGDKILEALEFVVHEDGAYLEATTCIQVHDAMDPGSEVLGRLRRSMFCGDQINSPQRAN